MSNADPKTQRALATMQPFLASFLGLAAVRVWMQSNLFGSYTQSDAGLLSIVNQLFYGLTMLIAACIALRKAPSPSASNAIAWTGCVLMTLSTVFLVVSTEIHAAWAFAATCVLGGIGGAFGGGTWIAAYVRLGVRQAILYGFLSLALGSLGGLALSFMDESSAYVTSMFMPAISLLCYQKAMKAPLAPNPEKPVYDNEPRKTTATFLIGFAIFGLALGISRGFPMGEPVSMGVSGRIVHQLGVVAIALFIVWWTCIAQKRLSFIFLWRIEIALVAGGMLLLSTLPDEAAPFAIAIVNIADTLMLAVIWVTMQDVSRHSSVNPLAIYGFAWAARVLARDLGRVTIIALGATGIASTAANVIIGIVVFALAMSMALLLSGGLPQTRPLFDTGDENQQARTTASRAPPCRRGIARPRSRRRDRQWRAASHALQRVHSPSQYRCRRTRQYRRRRNSPRNHRRMAQAKLRPFQPRSRSCRAHRPRTQQELHCRNALCFAKHRSHPCEKRLCKTRHPLEPRAHRPRTRSLRRKSLAQL